MKLTLSTLFALSSVVALSSCTTPPPVEHPDLNLNLPQEWALPSPGERKLQGPWWNSFGDSDLSSLIQEALDHNHDLKAALARLEKARARGQVVGASSLPSANLSLDASRRKMNFIGFPIPNGGGDVLSTRSTNLQLSLNTQWELDLWGRIKSGQEAALADIQAQELDLAAFKESLASKVCNTWFNLLEAQQQLKLAEETEESLRKTSEWIKNRYRSGLRKPLDLRLSESLLASAQERVTAQQQIVDSHSRQIEILLGRYPQGEIQSQTQLPQLPREIPAGLPALLVSQRPDVRKAERQLAASRARYREAKASLYPRIALTASGGTSTEKLEDLLNGDFSVWSIAGNIVQPLFEGGRIRAQIKVSEAEEKEILSLYANTVLRAFSEVELALASENFLAKREASLERAFLQAKEAERLSQDQYRNGLGTFLLYLESQRQAIQAQQQWLRVKRQRLESRVSLHLALGGNFGASFIHPEDEQKS